MERIVIGLDGSAASQVAVDWVLERTRTRRASVTLVTLFDMLADDPLEAEKILRGVQDRMRRARSALTVETSIVERSIHEGLIEHSRGADLLVMGSHPSGWVGAALTGALPVRVAARAHCPTVLVPEDWARHGTGVIVAGVGDDRTADRAVLFAANEAVQDKRELELVHAWRVPVPLDLPAGGVLMPGPDELRDAHRDLLRDVVERTRAAFPRARIVGVLTEGGAGERIESRMSRAELVVLGTRGLGPLSGLLLGSTLQHVLRIGRVPVCVVPLEPGASTAGPDEPHDSSSGSTPRG